MALVQRVMYRSVTEVLPYGMGTPKLHALCVTLMALCTACQINDEGLACASCEFRTSGPRPVMDCFLPRDQVLIGK